MILAHTIISITMNVLIIDYTHYHVSQHVIEEKEDTSIRYVKDEIKIFYSVHSLQ